MNPFNAPPNPQADNLRSPPESLRTFDKAYVNFAPRVRGYLRRLNGGDAADAEDAAQEVFLAAYSGRSAYKGTAPPLAWLLGIARRRWRDRTRGVRLETSEVPPERCAPDNPEADTLRAVRLDECLRQLEPANRDALLLVFGQGLTYAEAAAALGEPLGTVKWRVHAASRRMRELLRADDEELLP